MRGDGGDLARVVRLDAADRDERVAALGERVRREVLELAHLVAAVGEAGVAVLALGPDLDPAAEVLAQPVEAVHRGGAERERHAREVGKGHGVCSTATPRRYRALLSRDRLPLQLRGRRAPVTPGDERGAQRGSPHSGSSTIMRQPVGSACSAWIVPPCSSTIQRAIASPSPAPPRSAERARSER